MKKLCLLSGMMVFVVAGVNAAQNLTDEQRQKLEQVQWGKIRQQHELARPATYKMLDPLVQQSNWPAVFHILDQMQGVISVNEYRYHGDTLLTFAVGTKNISAAKTLLEKYKANPNVTSLSFSGLGLSPLMQACITGDLAMVKLLLSYKANPFLMRSGEGITPGSTALFYAKYYNYPEIVKLLEKYTRPAKDA